MTFMAGYERQWIISAMRQLQAQDAPRKVQEGFKKEYEHRCVMTDQRLESFFQNCPAPALAKAMQYSINSGGKRIRPVFTLAFCAAAGGDEIAALDIACSVELLHSYSLIHDDLPCMDDDDMRRGMPSSHAAFGEAQAVLAGDALQAAAFEKVLSADLPAERVVRCARALAHAAGEQGICAGQTLDIQAQERGRAEMSELYKIHHLKTAALIEAACVMGVIAAGGTEEQERAARLYANAVGLAYQIRDDVIDNAKHGRKPESDMRNGKPTFLALLGAEKCEYHIREQTLMAHEAMNGQFHGDGFLSWFAEALSARGG